MNAANDQWLSTNAKPVYHLPLQPENIASTIIIVGDPGRIKTVSAHFDTIAFTAANREFSIATGIFSNHNISVISSGIGVDNIDILLNELTYLKGTGLTFIRLGTTGAVQPNLAPGSIVVSKYAVGIEGLMHHYQMEYSEEELALSRAFEAASLLPPNIAKPYAVACSDALDRCFPSAWKRGITLTANGFYGPQFRNPAQGQRSSNKTINDLGAFFFNTLPLTNIEMECSGIYGLAKLFGHRAITICTVIANRSTGAISQQPDADVKHLVHSAMASIAQQVLENH